MDIVWRGEEEHFQSASKRVNGGWEWIDTERKRIGVRRPFVRLSPLLPVATTALLEVSSSSLHTHRLTHTHWTSANDRLLCVFFFIAVPFLTLRVVLLQLTHSRRRSSPSLPLTLFLSPSELDSIQMMRHGGGGGRGGGVGSSALYA